ncbi:DUF4139 domain-containing protein [Aliikangiella sp. IMCC44359]|uniref:DUF4139 domain-containing protein n=1 Tax=Aliikangiella sp. IMCC44359 TaxID=3459125 RepID=UPI00403ABD02
MKTKSQQMIQFSCLLTAGLLTMPLIASEQDAVTIYSKAKPGSISPDVYRPVQGRSTSRYTIPGYAIIKSQREYALKKGVNQLEVSDVAALLDPTTVSFISKTDSKATVLEQNYQFDLVSQEKLLQRYLGKTITVEQVVGSKVNTLSGELISASDGIILRDSNGSIHSMRSYSNLRFPDLPGGLRTKPTLIWSLDTKKGGKQDIELSYETQGMTWWADYNVIYRNNKRCRMDLFGWVSIINQSGASFKQAKLKLVAGDVNRAKPERDYMYDGPIMVQERAPRGSHFEEKSFFEYHLYTLGRAADIPNNSTKQLELIPKINDVQCKKELVFDATQQFGRYSGRNTDRNYGKNASGDVNVYLRFKNSKKNHMGIPLPAGRIRVNQRDSDGNLEFIGEDIIDHTPKNEEVLIKMGNAFDIKGERKQVDYRVDTKNKEMSESFEITLKNHKDTAANVVIRESLYRWSNWKVVKKSHDYSKQDARHIHFDMKVPANGEVKVSYTVDYTW